MEIHAGDGARLAAERLPSDGPCVVLLHAGVADRRGWVDVAADLHRRGADVVSYDRRGFGETPATEGDFRHDEDLLAVLDAAGREQAWLVGNSQGGLIALDVAVRAPERLAGLVLIAPAVSGAPEPDDDELDPSTRRLAEEIDRADERGDMEALNQLEIQLWLDGPGGPAGRVRGDARALALTMNATALASGMPEGSGATEGDAWSRLGSIEVPVTVAWGSLDIPVIIDRCRELAERLGDPRGAVELPGMAHLPSLERPDLAASLIADAIGL